MIVGKFEPPVLGIHPIILNIQKIYMPYIYVYIYTYISMTNVIRELVTVK